MPTTIYDSSLLTTRKRDKAIAQEVQQRNAAGEAIITPQAGYAAYNGGEADQGAVNYYRKVGGCTFVSPACACDQVVRERVEEDGILLYTFLQYNSSVQVYLEVAGSGRVAWGDGSFTDFNTPAAVQGLYHTYVYIPPSGCPTSYSEYKTITITGAVGLVKTSPNLVEGQDPNYTSYPFADVHGITILKADTLETLVNLNGNLNYIINLDRATALLTIELSGTALDLSTAGGSGFTSLTQLLYIVLQKIGTVSTNGAGEFVNVFPNALSLILNSVSSSGITGIDTVYASSSVLQYLSLSNNGLVVTLPLLPSSLTTLDLQSTGITSLPTLPSSGLQVLNVANCLVTSLPVLPSTLLELYVNGTGVTSLPSPMPNLTILNMSGCDLSITGVPTNLPSSLQILYIDNTQLNTFTPDLSIVTPQLKELYMGSNQLSGTPLTAFPSTLERFDSNNNTGITSYPPFPPSLVYLNLYANFALTALDPSITSTSLIELDLSYAQNLATIPPLPNSLEILYLRGPPQGFANVPSLSNTSLRILVCDGIIFASNTLPALPNTLTDLDVSASNINNLNSLPTSLVTLRFNNCVSLTTQSSLTSLTNLQNISATPCYIQAFPDIPASLLFLELSTTTVASFTLPTNLGSSNLTQLFVSGCTTLTDISNLPTTLEILEAGGCTALNNASLPVSFPNPLQTLSLQGSVNITAIPSLFNTSIQYLNIYDMPTLVLIPYLPTSIQYLQAQNSSNVTPYALEGFNDVSLEFTCMKELKLFNAPLTALFVLPTLPNTLTQLLLSNCANLEESSLPSAFPDSLQTLEIGFNANITVLPSLTNTSLIALNIQWLSNLQNMPILPSTLTALVADNCSTFTNTSLPASFPDGLLSLAIGYNANITTLPSLANTSITLLDIINMPSLVKIPFLPSTIQTVYAQNLFGLGGYALEGFEDSGLASFTSLNVILLFNMNNGSFVSPFPALPPSLAQFDVGGSQLPIANQAYIDAIATNIVNNNPPLGGIFNASNMGIVIVPFSPLNILQTSYSWTVIV